MHELIDRLIAEFALPPGLGFAHFSLNLAHRIFLPGAG